MPLKLTVTGKLVPALLCAKVAVGEPKKLTLSDPIKPITTGVPVKVAVAKLS